MALGLVARAWLATLRLTLVVDPAVDLAGQPLALAFWHGQQLALLRWACTRRMVALVSRSKDGELVARALGVLGVGSARGSSSRGGTAGLKAVVRALRGGFDAAFAVDGPRGPARVVRTEGAGVGVVQAARLGRAVVVPMAAACRRRHVVRRAWDGFELPLPFTRVVVVLGAPIDVEEATAEVLAGSIEGARGRAEAVLRAGGDARARRAGDAAAARASEASEASADRFSTESWRSPCGAPPVAPEAPAGPLPS